MRKSCIVNQNMTASSVALVSVVNSPWKRDSLINRRKAERLIEERRAMWVDEGHSLLRMLHHEKNIAAARRGVLGYNDDWETKSGPVSERSVRSVERARDLYGDDLVSRGLRALDRR